MRRSLASFILIIAVISAQQQFPSAMAATAVAAAPVAVGAELEKALEGLDSGLVSLRYPSFLERVSVFITLSCNCMTQTCTTVAGWPGAASLALPVTWIPLRHSAVAVPDINEQCNACADYDFAWLLAGECCAEHCWLCCGDLCEFLTE
jgi:hypothetical protein